MRRLLLLLGAIAAMASVPIATSQAQDTRTPTWTKGATNQPLEYSYDGSVVLARDSSVVRAWSTATQRLIALVGVSNTAATPAPDGSGFYYATGSPAKFYFYNFTTRATTLIRAEGSGFQDCSAIGVSTDNAALVASVYNTANAKYYIRATTISTGALAGSYSAIGTGIAVPQVQYVHNNTKILVSGAACRTLTSACVWIANRSNMGAHSALSPNRQVAYTRGTNGTLYALDVTSTATSIPILWQVASSSIHEYMKVSADGNVLISGGNEVSNDNAYWAFRFYNTSNGSKIATDGINYSTFAQSASYASNPSTNEIIFYNYDPSSQIFRYSLNTAAGTGTQLASFDDGAGGSTLQTFGTTTPFFATDDMVSGGSRVRNATTGAQTFYSSTYYLKYSPDGQYFAWIGSRSEDNGYGVHIYRMSDLARRASFLNGNIQEVGWNSNNQLWAKVHSPDKVRVMTFTGSALTLVNEVTGPTSTYLALSADATRLAWNNGNQMTIYDVTANTLVGTFDATGYSGLQAFGFAGNYLWIHHWLYDGSSTWTNQVQFRSVSTNAFPIFRTVSYTSSTTYGSDTGKVAVANDASIVAFGRYLGQNADGRYETEMKVIRAADNQVLRNFNNQFADIYFGGIAFSTDNATLVSNGYYAYVLIGSEAPTVLNKVEVSPTSVVGGNNSTGTVTLNRPAPTGGVTVTLASDNAAASVPASVNVAAGNTSATFNITTSGVPTSQQVQVSGTYDGLAVSSTLTVTPPTSIGIGFNPNSVDGGQSSTGTVTINGKAPSGGYSVNLSSNKTSVTVPGSVIVPEGQTSITFTANTTDPGTTETATVTGTHDAVSGQGTLEVKAGGAVVTILESAVKGGNALTLRITIPNPAPAGGLTYNLTGDALSAPPATAKIAEGKTTIDVGVNTNATLTDGTTTVTVTPAAGGASKQASATVQAPLIRALYLAQTPVAGAKVVKLLVLLDGIAPSGLSYSVTSNNTSATVPSTVTIPAGSLFATVDVTAKKVTVAKKTVKVTVGTKSVFLTLLVNP